ncbi:MAG TPA: hypothetical protein PLQ76_06755 [bacterium]|nr:hypothetical protein [bacterium]
MFFFILLALFAVAVSFFPSDIHLSAEPGSRWRKYYEEAIKAKEEKDFKACVKKATSALKENSYQGIYGKEGEDSFEYYPHAVLCDCYTALNQTKKASGHCALSGTDSAGTTPAAPDNESPFPTIVIDEPDETKIVTESASARISGTVADDEGVKTILINDETICDSSEGGDCESFEKIISLKPGANEITVKATDFDGHESFKNVSMISKKKSAAKDQVKARVSPRVSELLKKKNSLIENFENGKPLPTAIQDEENDDVEKAIADLIKIFLIKLGENYLNTTLKKKNPDIPSKQPERRKTPSNKPPELTIKQPRKYQTVKIGTTYKLILQVKATDPDGSVNVIKVGNEYLCRSNCSGEYQFQKELSAGAHFFRITAKDNKGDETYKTLEFVIDNRY